jgi:hypothetical protein
MEPVGKAYRDFGKRAPVLLLGRPMTRIAGPGRHVQQ